MVFKYIIPFSLEFFGDRVNPTMKTPVTALLVEGIHPEADRLLGLAGLKVRRSSGALSLKDPVEELKDVSVLGSRSRTEIGETLLKKSNLLAVGAFCIGVNQIDLRTASRQGVAVFNAPYSNTRSVAELVAGFIIALSRRLCGFSQALHGGSWNKSAVGSFEIRGKTLGIVGYGHIGSQVSVLAEAMGMKVIYYDIISKLPIGNAKPCLSLSSLLSQCDFVTLHVPETPETRNMISKKEIGNMKKGAFLINTSRGSVVDMESLKSALTSRHLSGAALDVFPEEPLSSPGRFKSSLQNLPGVILTPHIGGSTEEAQRAIGREVSESLIRYLCRGSTESSVNFPKISLPPVPSKAGRIVNVHKNRPGVLGQINNIVSQSGANIQAQYLSTNEEIGYLAMDVETENVEDLCSAMMKLPLSIKTRRVRGAFSKDGSSSGE